MTAIELQKPLSLNHVQASLAAALVHMVFENISKQYRLGLVSTETLSLPPVPNTISQEKFSRQMYTSLF